MDNHDHPLNNNSDSGLCPRVDPQRPAPTITNFTLVEKSTEQGTKFVAVPKPLSQIVAEIHTVSGGWPRRVGSVAFADDNDGGGIRWFCRNQVAGLFAWLKSRFQVEWKTGGDLVTHAQLFAELEHRAPTYDAVEELPHEPPLNRVYYRGSSPPPGSGAALEDLLERFRPATKEDRELLKGALMTTLWGGPPGMRPVFVVTSDDGRGVGKSKAVDVLTYVTGGSLDVDAGCDVAELKQRVLSPEGLSKRTAVLDNVKSLKFSWAELEKLITAREISGKQMYVGEAKRPNYLTWFITLNGVSLGDDMAQRAVIIKVIRGKNSGTWYEDVIGFVDKNREQIIGDLIAALRVPRQHIRFGRWSAWENDVLARLNQPAALQSLILERQREANCELDEAELIEEQFAEQLRLLGYCPETDIVHISTARAAEWFNKATGEHSKTTAASKRLTQLSSEKQNQSDEGKLNRIKPNPCRSNGRGFLWIGQDASVHEKVDYNLDFRAGTTLSTSRYAA